MGVYCIEQAAITAGGRDHTRGEWTQEDSSALAARECPGDLFYGAIFRLQMDRGNRIPGYHYCYFGIRQSLHCLITADCHRVGERI